MVKKKRKNTKNTGNLPRNLAYIFFFSLIIFGVWSTCSSQSELGKTETQIAVPTESERLLQVVMPPEVENVDIEYTGFNVSFNPKHRVPNYVAWELTRQESQAQDFSRQDADFNADVTVDESPQIADYKGSGYDRGHMCPAGDMKWDQQGMRDCFLLTNMCPQTHSLNNGSWKSLEESCRTWAVRDSAIVIICGPILTDKITRTIGDGRVSVPERFFKVIFAPYANPPRAIGFIMPNGKVSGGFQTMAATVDQIEEITGFDFFSSLPDDIENKIEAECNFRTWQKP